MCETVDAIYRADSRGVPSRVAAPSEVKTNRAFNTALWRYILDYLEVQAPDGGRTARAWRRNRFLLYLGYGTGLRLAELAGAKLGDLKLMAGEALGESFWVLSCGTPMARSPSKPRSR